MLVTVLYSNNHIVQSAKYLQDLQSLEGTRRDRGAFRIIYVDDDGNRVELPDGSDGIVGIKPADVFAGDYLCSKRGWRKVGSGSTTEYVFDDFWLSSDEIDAAFTAITEGASIPCGIEISWTEPLTTEQSTKIISYTLYNDLNQGDEGIAGPARPMYYNRDQALAVFSPLLAVGSLTGSDTPISVTGVAATDILTAVAHGLSDGARMRWEEMPTGGTGFAINTDYYVLYLGPDTFQLSLTQGGAKVDFTTDLTAGSLRFVSHSLAGYPTAGVSVPRAVDVLIARSITKYILVAGTDAQASPGIIRPNDYASGTNEKVYVQVG